MPRTSHLEQPNRTTVKTSDEPTFAEVVAAAAFNFVGPQDNRLSENAQQVLRTWTGSSGGATGGFIIKPTWQDDIIDRARSVDGPLARCTLCYMEGRERLVPSYQESSRADGFRWGGARARWGTTEIASLDAIESLPSMAMIRFVAQRLMILSQPLSRDLFADSAIIPSVLDYAFNSEIRYALEAAITSGTGPGMPQSLITSAATITVPKDASQTATTISSTNIDAVWRAIYGPCKRNCVWMANDDTIQAIDEAAQGQTGSTAGTPGTGWPESIYLPQGRYGNEVPLIKGRPLLMNESCPTLGTPGDLIACDLSQYWLCIHRPKMTDTQGPAFSVGMVPDEFHSGLVALPEGAVESTISDQFLYDTDELIIKYKLRADGKFIWTSPITNINGVKLGPCAIIQAR